MKRFLIISVLVLILASCKKSNSGDIVPTNTITATINGTNYIFDKNAYTSIDVDDYGEEISLNVLDSNSNSLRIFINATGKIKSTTYSSTMDSTGQYGFFSLNTPVDSITYEPAVTIPNPVTVTVTSITSAAIQGTFQGTIFPSGDVHGVSKIITNGKFSVAR